MKKVIIISGHGNYATGLQSCIELLAGRNEEVYFIDFIVDDTEASLTEKLMKVVNSHSGSEVLFICDILGGTPFKMSAQIANDKANMEVVNEKYDVSNYI
jgi:PTS system N-acetylgalactosamine-specific IIA component